MTDDLIRRLSDDLRPSPSRALERSLALAFSMGMVVTVTAGALLLTSIGRPFGAAFGSPMFWVKAGYTLGFGLLGLAATPVLARPDGRIMWPLAGAAGLALLALLVGTLSWMQQDWAMPALMGGTAMVCPWLITVTGIPVLFALLLALRRAAPRSPALAGLAAGLVAGGFGAWVYAFYCGETGLMFMAVWYTLGMAVTALLGLVLGRLLLRW